MTALSITVSGTNGTKSIRNLTDVERVSDHNGRKSETSDDYFQRPGPINQQLIGEGSVLEDLKKAYDKYVQPFYDAYNQKRVDAGKGVRYKKNAFETQIEKNKKYDEKQSNKNKNKNKTADLMTEIIFKAGSYEEIIERIAKGESEADIRKEQATICWLAMNLFLEQNPNFKAVSAHLHNDEKGGTHVQLCGIHVEKTKSGRGLGVNLNHNATFKHESNDVKKMREQARKLATNEDTHEQARTLYDNVRSSASWASGTLTYLHNGFKDEIASACERYGLNVEFNKTQDERGTFYSTDAYINYIEKKKLNELESKKHFDLKKQSSQIESEIERKVVIKRNIDSEIDDMREEKLNLIDERDKLQSGNQQLINGLILKQQQQQRVEKEELERQQKQQQQQRVADSLTANIKTDENEWSFLK